MTHDPSLGEAVRELLGVSPVAEERVIGVEGGGERPLSEPEWAVALMRVVEDTTQVCARQ